MSKVYTCDLYECDKKATHVVDTECEIEGVKDQIFLCKEHARGSSFPGKKSKLKE